MGVRADCRHYVMRSVGSGDRVEQCRVGAGGHAPFACPDGCVLFEARATSSAGWRVRGEGQRREPGGHAGPEPRP
jgi:hypothetical protein